MRSPAADGEYQASTRLAEAATAMAADPAALRLRLRLRQTVVEVAAEKNSTLVMPFPVELLRFFDNASPAPNRIPAAAASTRAAEGPPQTAGTPALTGAKPVDITSADMTLARRPNGAQKEPATA